MRDQTPPDVTDSRVVILDFCYTLQETIEMASVAKSILIIDHHETSKNLLGKVPKNVEMIIDVTKSGSQMAWEYMYGTTPPWFIDVIAAHDLWKWDVHPEYKYISDALYRRGYYSWERLEELYGRTMEAGQDKAIEEVITLDKKLSSKVIEATDPEEELMKKTIKTAHHNSFLTKYTGPDGSTYKVRIVNFDRKVRSEVGNSLCIDCDFAIVWQYDFLTNQWWCACRARQNSGVDLAKIAALHGGGGHKLAASFVIYGDKGEDLHTYFELMEVPKHRTEDARKYKIECVV